MWLQMASFRWVPDADEESLIDGYVFLSDLSNSQLNCICPVSRSAAGESIVYFKLS